MCEEDAMPFISFFTCGVHGMVFAGQIKLTGSGNGACSWIVLALTQGNGVLAAWGIGKEVTLLCFDSLGSFMCIMTGMFAKILLVIVANACTIGQE